MKRRTRLLLILCMTVGISFQGDRSGYTETTEMLYQYWVRNSSSGYTSLSNPKDNVGIGISSPSAKLDVAGTVRSTASSNAGGFVTRVSGDVYDRVAYQSARTVYGSGRSMGDLILQNFPFDEGNHYHSLVYSRNVANKALRLMVWNGDPTMNSSCASSQVCAIYGSNRENPDTKGNLIAYGPNYNYAPSAGFVQVSCSKGKGIYVSALTATGIVAFRSGGAEERMRIAADGKVGIGIPNPTAYLHLNAGSGAANTAPIKLSPGSKMSSPENGAMEYDGSHLYFTVGSDRCQLDQPSGSGSYSWSGTTTNPTETELFINGASPQRIKLPAFSGMAFDLMIVAKDNTSNKVNSYHFKGSIRRDGSEKTVLGKVVKEDLEEETAMDANVYGDNKSGSLVIKVIGKKSDTVKWKAIGSVVTAAM
jgi:hypothetical protein